MAIANCTAAQIKRWLCIGVVCALLWPLAGLASERASFQGKVVGVTDGDTIEVMRGGAAVKVRLHGIDCPESGQPFSQYAKQFTSHSVFGKSVTVWVNDVDRYGRLVGTVITPDNRSLNDELVRNGFAWWYREYAPGDVALQQLEGHARSNRLGLWSDPAPIPPWQWRKSGNRAQREIQNQNANPRVLPQSGTVYVTNSGTKFHVGGCRHLAKSQIPISIAAAVNRGYTACGVCLPSLSIPRHQRPQQRQVRPSPSPRLQAPLTNQNGAIVVYVTRTGTKYHLGTCRHLAQSRIPVDLRSAAARYSPCGTCRPPG